MVGPDNLNAVLDCYGILLGVIAISLIPYQIPIRDGVSLAQYLTSRELESGIPGLTIASTSILHFNLASLLVTTSLLTLGFVIKLTDPAQLYWITKILSSHSKEIIHLLFLGFTIATFSSLVFLIYSLYIISIELHRD